VAAIDVGHRRHGCGVVVGFVAIGVGWWWVFTTPSCAHQSAGAGDVAQRRCIVEVVGGGSYGQRPSSLWVWGGDEPLLLLVLWQQQHGSGDRCRGQWWWLRTEVGNVAPASNVSKKI